MPGENLTYMYGLLYPCWGENILQTGREVWIVDSVALAAFDITDFGGS